MHEKKLISILLYNSKAIFVTHIPCKWTYTY